MDKPIYRPGETAFVEIYFFDSLTKRPYLYNDDGNELWCGLFLFDSSDNQMDVSFESHQVQNATITFTLNIPDDIEGGEYHLRTMSWDTVDTSRKFRINSFKTPELYVTVDFDKNNYSPG